MRRRMLLGLISAAALGLLTAPALAQTAFNVGYIPVVGSSQIFVIEGEGWAKQAGIDLKLTRFDSGPAMIQALASGQLDGYLAGIGPIMVARGQGISVKVVASAAIEELAVIGRGAFAEQIEKSGSVKQAVADFTTAQKRKPKIATQPPGSVPDTVMRYWMEKVEGVDPAGFEILGIGIDATQQAFLSNAVDAAIVREPTLTLIRDRDPKTKVVALGGKMFPNQPGSVLAVIQNEAKRKAIDDLVRLHVRATELIAKEPKRAAVHVHKVLGAGIVPLDVIERALVSPSSNFTADPSRIIESTATMQDYQLKLGVLKQSVPVNDIFDLEPFRRSGS